MNLQALLQPVTNALTAIKVHIPTFAAHEAMAVDDGIVAIREFGPKLESLIDARVNQLIDARLAALNIPSTVDATANSLADGAVGAGVGAVLGEAEGVLGSVKADLDPDANTAAKVSAINSAVANDPAIATDVALAGGAQVVAAQMTDGATITAGIGEGGGGDPAQPIAGDPNTAAVQPAGQAVTTDNPATGLTVGQGGSSQRAATVV